jgi:undecaprenyl-diphosphatase
MFESVVLGLIQGITEWLPVSSEGLITLASTILFSNDPNESVDIALWVHLGTAISAGFVFRSDVSRMAISLFKSPTKPTPEVKFFIIGMFVSACLGLPLLVIMDNITSGDAFKTNLSYVMGTIGVCMVATGLILLRSKKSGIRLRSDVKNMDGLITGIAQGVSALPGLSRSGLTVSAMLARGLDKREALALSFMLGIPATAAAGIYSALSGGIDFSIENISALLIALISGVITIKILLKVAERINFGAIVLLVGILLALSPIIETVI